ncbi:MAG: hypothetical protein ABI723_14615 [Bacteroidia bacterium]
MQTVTIKVKSDSFAKALSNTFKNHKEVETIHISNEDDENFAMPGPPMTLEQFKSRIKKAEQAKMMTEEEAVAAIKSWKPKKRK